MFQFQFPYYHKIIIIIIITLLPKLLFQCFCILKLLFLLLTFVACVEVLIKKTETGKIFLS